MNPVAHNEAKMGAPQAVVNKFVMDPVRLRISYTREIGAAPFQKTFLVNPGQEQMLEVLVRKAFGIASGLEVSLVLDGDIICYPIHVIDLGEARRATKVELQTFPNSAVNPALSSVKVDRAEGITAPSSSSGMSYETAASMARARGRTAGSDYPTPATYAEAQRRPVPNNSAPISTVPTSSARQPVVDNDGDFLNKEDRRKNNRGLDHRRSYLKEEKILVMWLKDIGKSADDIARMTQVSKSNVEKWCSDKMRERVMQKALTTGKGNSKVKDTGDSGDHLGSYLQPDGLHFNAASPAAMQSALLHLLDRLGVLSTESNMVIDRTALFEVAGLDNRSLDAAAGAAEPRLMHAPPHIIPSRPVFRDMNSSNNFIMTHHNNTNNNNNNGGMIVAGGLGPPNMVRQDSFAQTLAGLPIHVQGLSTPRSLAQLNLPAPSPSIGSAELLQAASLLHFFGTNSASQTPQVPVFPGSSALGGAESDDDDDDEEDKMQQQLLERMLRERRQVLGLAQQHNVINDAATDISDVTAGTPVNNNKRGGNSSSSNIVLKSEQKVTGNKRTITDGVASDDDTEDEYDGLNQAMQRKKQRQAIPYPLQPPPPPSGEHLLLQGQTNGNSSSIGGGASMMVSVRENWDRNQARSSGDAASGSAAPAISIPYFRDSGITMSYTTQQNWSDTATVAAGNVDPSGATAAVVASLPSIGTAVEMQAQRPVLPNTRYLLWRRGMLQPQNADDQEDAAVMSMLGE